VPLQPELEYGFVKGYKAQVQCFFLFLWYNLRPRILVSHGMATIDNHLNLLN
jgi:hypothetical protein